MLEVKSEKGDPQDSPPGPADSPGLVDTQDSSQSPADPQGSVNANRNARKQDVK